MPEAAVEYVRSSPDLVGSFQKAVDTVARERRFLGTVQGFPLESARGFLGWVHARNLPQVFALAGGQVVGWCDIIPRDVPEFSHVGVLGMGVLAPYRGKGLGRRLLELTLAHAKDVTGLEKVELTVYRSNTGAIALYEKFGFVLEGTRVRSRRIDGNYDDEVLMGKFL